MNASTRRLASFLVLAVLFAAGLYRLEQVASAQERDRTAAESRACVDAKANREAITKVVNIALRESAPPAGADAAQEERVRVGNAARTALRDEILKEIGPLECEKAARARAARAARAKP